MLSGDEALLQLFSIPAAMVTGFMMLRLHTINSMWIRGCNEPKKSCLGVVWDFVRDMLSDSTRVFAMLLFVWTLCLKSVYCYHFGKIRRE